MSDFNAALHRTLIDYLLAATQNELAALLLDARLEAVCYYNKLDDYWGFDRLIVDIPSGAADFLAPDGTLFPILESALRRIAVGQRIPCGHTPDDPEIRGGRDFKFQVRIRLLDPVSGWQEAVRERVMNPGGSNQGLVSELARDGRPLLTGPDKTGSATWRRGPRCGSR